MYRKRERGSMEHENKRCEGMNEDILLLKHHQHQNHFYDQIEAHHSAASNPTGLLVAKVKQEAKTSVAVDFPFHVLILILARLPAKTLLKFRCVCKSWNSLIQQDHHFISLHQLHLNDNNKGPPPLVTYRHERFCRIVSYSSSSSVSTPYEIESGRGEDPPQFITNSCNGLLGLYNSYNFFIANPTIRKLRQLPRTTPPCSLSTGALGFDASTGVYKVVRIFDREFEGNMPVRFGCEVCYLGGSGGWKLVDEPPVQPSYVSFPVVVDGAVLWASEAVWGKHLEVVALSFDLREEKFSVIMHPEGSSRRTFSESHVFASGGCICVADEIESPADTSVHMNIWLLMKDSKWVKQYVIDLTYVLKQMGPFCRVQPLTTDNNGRIVISWGQGRILFYDPRTGSFHQHELDATLFDGVEEHAAPYTESMVWPWPS
ncbi:F-box protein-like [Iris pallida]|uniref:F-box protein-like n=1 Tax=Iris pallida TaxID=29817 RepID=A0AAX6GZJ2_IRIPA|nr:F-box protein-like [Iris pallida]